MVGDSRRVWVIGKTVQHRAFACRFSRLAVQCIFGSEHVRYSNEPASSLSSTASAVPLLPHGRRLGVVQACRDLLMEGGYLRFLAIKNGAIVWCDSPVCGLFGFSAFVAEVAPLDGCFAAGPVVDLVGGFGFFFLWDCLLYTSDAADD